jgi:hypothetical protein
MPPILFSIQGNKESAEGPGNGTLFIYNMAEIRSQSARPDTAAIAVNCVRGVR